MFIILVINYKLSNLIDHITNKKSEQWPSLRVFSYPYIYKYFTAEIEFFIDLFDISNGRSLRFIIKLGE